MQEQALSKMQENKVVWVFLVENSLSKFHHWAGHAPGFVIPNTFVLCPYIIRFLLLHEG